MFLRVICLRGMMIKVMICMIRIEDGLFLGVMKDRKMIDR